MNREQSIFKIVEIIAGTLARYYLMNIFFDQLDKETSNSNLLKDIL